MALDHPALNLPTSGWLRSSRPLELGVVVALAVAVVVVAALWESTSESVEPVSVGSVETASQAPANPTADASPSSNVAEAVSAASAKEVSSTISRKSAVASLEQDSTAQATVAGVVREVPNFGGRPLPSSFEQYQVQRGETLRSIADAVGLPVSDLLLWNLHLEEDSVLIPGEWLSIPRWDVPAVADESPQAAEEGKSGRGGG